MTAKKLIILMFIIECGVGMCFAQELPHLISIDKIASKDIIVRGSYCDLVSAYGSPSNVLRFAHSDVQQSASGLQMQKYDSLSYLIYDGYSYIRKNDSVQLVFIDFKKTSKEITIGGIKLCKRSKIDDIVSQLQSLNIINSSLNDDEAYGTIEGHYLTYTKVKVLYLAAKTQSKALKESPSPTATGRTASVALCFYRRLFNKRLWYCEIPLVF